MQHQGLSLRPGVLGPAALFAASLGSFYLYTQLSGFLPEYGALLLYAGFQVALLGVVHLFAWSDGTRMANVGLVVHAKALRTILVAAVLFALLFVITQEPGFIYGFQNLGLASPPMFAFLLFSAPLIALSQEAVFRGYIMRKLALRGSFNRALFLSSFAFALFTTNLVSLFTLPFNAAMLNLFTVTVENLVLGLLLGMYFYKSAWSLLGPVVFRTGLILQGSIAPLVAKVPGWEFQFTFQLAGYMVVMLLVMVLLREPGAAAARYLRQEFGAKRNRMAQRERRRKEYRNVVVAAPVLIVLVLASTYGLQAAFATSTPFFAVASGSMVPVLHSGDLVLVQGVSNASQISVGDIVAYQSSTLNETVVHRVIQISGSGASVLFTTKGDANNAPDAAPVKFSQIRGRLILDIPVVGYLLLSPPLTVTLVLAILLLFSLLESRGAKKTLHRTGRRY